MTKQRIFLSILFEKLKNNLFFCHFSVDMLGSVFEPGPEDEWHSDLVYVAVCHGGKLLINKYLRQKFITSRLVSNTLRDLQ
jgi:hypothetical protein